ncbi:hypothetical protein KY347_04865 [Candidatus Woesearchaeota archaeon]|nr:hypothetical protein [Candidatus Woesearchaeota archaeon]
MRIFDFKKSEALTITLIIVVVLIFIGWLVSFSSRECRTNSHCADGFYCGSDFACHQIPVIEKTVVKNNLLVPSIIIGIAIILSAVILKSPKMPFRKGAHQEAASEKSYSNPLKTP